MKKLLYSTLAIAAVLAASCAQEVSKNNSEELAPVTGKHEVVYKGLASNVTKTAYADDKTFSWEAGEQIIAITGPSSEESEDQYYHGTIFTGDVAGTVTNFKGKSATDRKFLQHSTLPTDVSLSTMRLPLISLRLSLLTLMTTTISLSRVQTL